MKKIVTTTVLLIVIVSSFGFAWLRGMARGGEDSYFNRAWRERFAAYPWMRAALGLHFDGDARADYLGARYQKILIEVDEMSGEEVSPAVLDLLVQKVTLATGKPASYIFSDRSLPSEEKLDRSAIAKIVSRYRNYRSGNGAAALYLLYGSRDALDDNSLGTTYDEYGMVLFGDRLDEFVGQNSRTEDAYVASTALHEFGHQIGLPHNSEPGCLMNESVEQADMAWQRPRDVITDFCDYEKSLIRP